MATYCLFSLSSGLIKVSVLLFYRRLSARAVTSTSRWIIHATMFSIFGYTVAFSIVPIFACSPISAFWNQVDFGRTLQAGGYHYNCINEGADLLANGIISTVQDFIAALLPTLLCWRLQITIRQKIALYSVFAFSYSTVAIGAIRTYTGYRIFFTTYDVTWLASEMWLWTLLELHIGSMCANTPALKVFFGTMLQSERFTSWTRSWHTRSGSSHHRRSRGNSASKQRTWLKNKLGASTNTNDTSTAGSHQLVDWKGQGYNTSANRDPRGDIRQDPHNSFSRPFRPEFREVIIDSGPQSPSDRDIETASFASFVSLYNTKHVS